MLRKVFDVWKDRLNKCLLSANYTPGTWDGHSWVTEIPLPERSWYFELLALQAWLQLQSYCAQAGPPQGLMEAGQKGPAILGPGGVNGPWRPFQLKSEGARPALYPDSSFFCSVALATSLSLVRAQRARLHRWPAHWSLPQCPLPGNPTCSSSLLEAGTPLVNKVRTTVLALTLGLRETENEHVKQTDEKDNCSEC